MNYYFFFNNSTCSYFINWTRLLGLSMRCWINISWCKRMVLLLRWGATSSRLQFLFHCFFTPLWYYISTIIILRKDSCSIIIKEHIGWFSWRLTQIRTLITISPIVAIIVQTLCSYSFNCIMIHIMRSFCYWLFITILLCISYSFH